MSGSYEDEVEQALHLTHQEPRYPPTGHDDTTITGRALYQTGVARGTRLAYTLARDMHAAGDDPAVIVEYLRRLHEAEEAR